MREIGGENMHNIHETNNVEPQSLGTKYIKRRYLDERMSYETPDNETILLYPKSEDY